MRIVFLIMVICLASCCADRQTAQQPSFMQQPLPVSRINFQGYGKQFYVPDAFDMRGKIVLRNEDLRQGGKQHQEIVKAVKDYLAKLDNVNYSVTVGGLDTRSEWVGNNQKIKYYEFLSQVNIRCRDIGLMEDMQMDLIDLGMTQFSELSIFTENIHKITDLARDLAMNDARSKADYIAKQLGWKSYRVVDVKLGRTSGAFMAIGRGGGSNGAFGSRSGGTNTVGNGNGDSQSTFVDADITITIEPIL